MQQKRKNILLLSLGTVLVSLMSYQVMGQENFGFSKRFGGSEELREIQIAIMNNTADQVHKIQEMADQMTALTTNVDRQTAAVQALQKSIDKISSQMSAETDIIREQRDALNMIIRYMARQQQINDQLLEENRKIRMALEPKQLTP